MEEEDLREVELSTIAAIYYEELKANEQDPYQFIIELPMSLGKPLVVKFPAVATGAPPLQSVDPAAGPAGGEDSQEVSNLPALQIHVTLPEGYPQDNPPRVEVSTSPPWLSKDIVQKLESDASRLWEEVGRDQVIFTYIDDVQQSVDTVFGLVDEKGILEVAPEHKIAILDYDINAKRRAFEKETFDCGICLDPKKGLVCHRMMDCGHVFCVQCLQDFYNNAITEGDVASVRCLEPSCAEKRDAAARESTGSKRRKPKTFVSPSELLQIPLEQDMVKRYVSLKHKTELESDKNTVYCPRSWCQGAARSKRHKKPEGLNFAAESDDDSEPDTGDTEGKSKKFDSQDLLAICEDCHFAFCSRCRQSWHGEFKYCIPQERKDAITEEEKASLKYLEMHTTPCPTCAAPCQKTQGCNHMRCFRCQTHFCYLCSAWLNPGNPYQHFNIQPTGEINGCFMRLWELEGGDGDDVGVAFVGGDAIGAGDAGQYGQHLEVVQQAAAQQAAHRAVEDDSDSDSDFEDGRGGEAVAAYLAAAQQHPLPPEADQAPEQDQAERRVAVAREGPLVLRIEGIAQPARGRGGYPNHRAAPAAGRGGQAAHGGRRGGGRGNRGQRAPGVNRQNQQRGPRGPNQQVNRPDRNGRNVQNVGMADPLQEDELNQADEAWIRHFVQLALNDQEHLVEMDSDEDD